MNAEEILKNLGWPAGVVSPAALTASVNDYDPGQAGIWRVSADALGPWTITGALAPKEGGRPLLIVNVAANAITIGNENAGSAAANRFTTTTGGDLNLAADAMALAFYDITSARWRISLLP